MSPAVQMPRYRCHKEVYALQIDRIEGDILFFTEAKIYAPREVNPSIFARYRPKNGDYFVVYDDGYESISPQKAFEEGYRRISPSREDGSTWSP